MALILASVTDKTGLVDFAKKINSKNDVLFLASGGTASTLEACGIIVQKVSDYTGSPEMLNGRVKTLHPKIHAALLARDNETDLVELQKYNIKPIDILICNLYPFEKIISKKNVLESECIENIDIGGVALLRAAAKNFERLTVICDPSDYDLIADEYLQKGKISIETRRRLAIKAFSLCTNYDQAITSWLESKSEVKEIKGYKVSDLRYGENPHQKAVFYSNTPEASFLGGKLLQGKELSYNNILDCDAAWKAVSIFTNPAAVVIKHLTPCGIAELGKNSSDKNLFDAVKAAIECDPTSAYGSIIAVNRTFGVKELEAFGKLFVECLIAPSFTDEVKERLAKKKNWRVIEAPFDAKTQTKEFRSVLGGFLIQDVDRGDPEKTEYKVTTEKKPTKNEVELMHFAWKACTFVKSNSILLAYFMDASNPQKGFCTVGIGCGQPNRVDAARHAIERAGKKAVGSVLASDAFLPFSDTVQVASKSGISAIIQPGGSIRDAESIAECDKNNISMIFTGVRHFKH